ncbi:hypothetical protein GGD68_004235 [Paraburkholderia fungorum]|uniref:Uncharacterized protein n=1 Tax=Paraburkholderia fungorum TaxID=134537 RepID=A0AAW3UXM9_9BURK|nr:hypothetical protein [Paraburkholderia fungorum]MBB6203394.1 hypothetical protein [Paraburkholderia fungorum]
MQTYCHSLRFRKAPLCSSQAADAQPFECPSPKSAAAQRRRSYHVEIIIYHHVMYLCFPPDYPTGSSRSGMGPSFETIMS